MDDIRIVAIILLGIAGFAAFWVGIVRVIAAFGWSRLARLHTAPHDPPPTARLYSAQSLALGGASYRNSVNIWIDSSGIFLRPLLIFRMFHPPLLIRWGQVRGIAGRQSFLVKRVEVDLEGDLPALTLYGSSAGAVLSEWNARSR